MRNILQFTFGGILLRLISRIFLPVMFIFFSFVGNAQERIVTGKITDATDKAPIAGAAVRIKGTERGTTASADGTYKITVSDNNTLQFSFIGFAP
jgi:CarboxypepD_reg-like domain